MKRLFTFLTALAVAGAVSVQAQFVFKQAEKGLLERNPQTLTTPQFKSQQRVQLADNQLVMGGYTTDEYNTYGLGVGNYATGTLSAAIYLPINAINGFNGGQVVKMRVATAIATRVSRVFILPVVDGYIQDAIVDEEVASSRVGWSEFELSTPARLDFKNVDAVLMGFDYNQGGSNYPLSVVEAGEEYYGLFVYGNLGDGLGWYNFGNSYGNLSVQAIVEGDFQDNVAEPKPFGNVVIPFGGSADVTLSVINHGKSPLQSIDYTVAIDGVEGEEQHAEATAPAAFGTTAKFTVPFVSAETETTETRTITVKKVNGEKNGYAVNSVSGKVASTSKTVTHRVAVEEFTGTGCGWCPRGMIGMENLRHQFGDAFVGIALHQYNTSDAMYIATNSYANLGFTGAPQCTINRSLMTDPYYGEGDDIADDFRAALEQAAQAGIEVTGTWNEDSTSVEASATVLPIFDEEEYSLEFVLIADSLEGTGSAWNQSNYYTQYSSSQLPKDLAQFGSGGINGKSSITGWKYNDVALSSSYVNGRNQLEALTIESAAVDLTVSYTLTLPTKAALRNALKKDYIYVVALLVDNKSGIIINADKKQVVGTEKEPETDGIRSAAAQQSSTVVRYSLDGRRLTAPQHGLNIVRNADGSFRKVVK